MSHASLGLASPADGRLPGGDGRASLTIEAPRAPARPALGAATPRPGERCGTESLTWTAPAADGAGSPLAELTDALLGAMVEAWARGERPSVEDVLALCPDLAGHDESVARLVERELMLRREWGEPDRTMDLVRRFPAWAGPLARAGEPSEATACPPVDAEPPAVGEELGEFTLEAELGRGCRGYVFLASQRTLADRPVVLKVTPCDGGEHLALARLQHPHIVPLHGLCDLPGRGLRVLCMPYLGGAPLSRLLDMVRFVPPAMRAGRHLVRALESAERAAPARVPAEGSARRFLAHASYDRAICWIGSCLADALDSAHRRQLLHLDLKPSNVLLASDGRPMLLDFHLARGPIHAGSAAGCGLGGTPTYMAPEQRAAVEAVGTGRPVPVDVDARADVYGLGLVLHEALGGPMPRGGRSGAIRPTRSYPGVDAGLAAIVAKCLAPEPSDRYPDAAALAADLRRQLADQPLRGVAGPGLADRWKRWRRRRPHALAKIVLLAVSLGAMAVATAAAGIAARGRLAAAARALADSRAELERRDFATALREAEYGISRVDRLPLVERVRRDLDASLRQARRGIAADELHALAEAARRLDVVDSQPRSALEALERRAAEAWAARGPLLDDPDAPLAADLTLRVRDDLIDLAVALALVRTRLASSAGEADAHREALRVLTEAETALGPNRVLARERGLHVRALGLADETVAVAQASPSTARGHDALGRSFLRAGELEAALVEFDRALERSPRDLWAHFHRGVCAYRLGRHADAVEAFGACLVLDPERAEFALNRALARSALGDDDRALRDLDRALRLDPGSAIAHLSRGIAHFRAHRLDAARADFRRALEMGADLPDVHYNLALVDRAEGRPSEALAHLRAALARDPSHAPSAELARRLGDAGLSP